MASALARGIGEPVLVHDVDNAKAQALAEELGGEAVGSNAELAERADALVLCHKPKQLDEVAAEVGRRARMVISILAATTTASSPPRPPRRLDLPLHPEHERRGGAWRALLRGRAADGPRPRSSR